MARSHIECNHCFNTIVYQSDVYSTHAHKVLCSDCKSSFPDVWLNAEHSNNVPNEYFRCRYREHGCDSKYQWWDIIDHENVCMYRPFKCKFDCGWHGINLEDHYEQDHKITKKNVPMACPLEWFLDLDTVMEETLFNIIFRITDDGDIKHYLCTAEFKNDSKEMLSVELVHLNYEDTNIVTMQIGIEQYTWSIPSTRSKRQRIILSRDAFQNIFLNDKVKIMIAINDPSQLHGTSPDNKEDVEMSV